MTVNRRQFLVFMGSVGILTFGGASRASADTLGAGNNSQIAQNSDVFELPPLPYDYNALEPYIDETTMRFHHDKHHAGYTKKLNAAVNKYPELKNKSAEDLLRDLDAIPGDIRGTITNNGGGYVNHKMFWEIMSPDGGGEPTGAIADAINQNFGSFDAFKKEFKAAGSGRFGSGWAWLVLTPTGKLEVTSTRNQDSPLSIGNYPIMGNDVWEHAYYLKYKNDRGGYLDAWWNVVNWEEVNKRYQSRLS